MGGNYAASLRASQEAHKAGYSAEFYLDAKEKKYMDECGAANFFGIKNNTYITPLSTSILPSITNKSLMQLAEDMGLKVERRPVPEEELATFEEAGACGTAAVISPIQRIDDPEMIILMSSRRMASRARFVRSCIISCVLSSMVMSRIHTIG